MEIFPFKRYADAPEELDIAMPEDQLRANVVNGQLSELLGTFEEFTAAQKPGHEYPWADRFVMGLPLAPWQRDSVWTQEQQIRFIESIWSGVDIGSYLVNAAYEYVKDGSGKLVTVALSDILLDGQQRLTALQAYLTGEIAVPDTTGTPRFWVELPRTERRRFAQTKFARAEVSSYDEKLLRKAYDMRSFGGTPHLESERASAP